MKRYLAIVVAFAMIFSMTACGRASKLFEGNTSQDDQTNQAVEDESQLKAGFLFPSGNDAPDTVSHVEGIRKMQSETGLTDSQIVIKTNITKEQYESEIDALVEKGCDIIFAKSADSEEAMVAAAQKYPEVQFCQEDGKKAQKSGLSNYHNFYVKLYEAYYMAGIAAGMKMNEMLNDGKVSSYNCVIGFAATRENAENISCINGFSLGVKSVCTQASVLVRYVGSKEDYDADGECARQLIAAGAHMMCQRTFTAAIATVCAENDVPVVGNEVNMINTAPNEAITSTTADWSVYYTYAVNALLEQKEIDTDWCGGYKEGAVLLTQFNDKILADGTIDRVAEAEAQLRKGELSVFKTENFTIDGESLESLVENNGNYKKYKTYLKDGVFRESYKRSAPVMKFLIDGVSVSTGNYLEEEPQEATTEENQ